MGSRAGHLRHVIASPVGQATVSLRSDCMLGVTCASSSSTPTAASSNGSDKASVPSSVRWSRRWMATVGRMPKLYSGVTKTRRRPRRPACSTLACAHARSLGWRGVQARRGTESSPRPGRRSATRTERQRGVQRQPHHELHEAPSHAHVNDGDVRRGLRRALDAVGDSRQPVALRPSWP